MTRGVARRTVIAATAVVTASVLAVTGGGSGALAAAATGAPASSGVAGAVTGSAVVPAPRPVPGAEDDPPGDGPPAAPGDDPDAGPAAEPAPVDGPAPADSADPASDPASGPADGPAPAEGPAPADDPDVPPAADPAAGGDAPVPAPAAPEQPSEPATDPGRPADDPAGEPGPPPGEAPAAPPGDDPAAPPGDDPATRPTGPGEDPAAGPAEDPSARPADQSVPKPGAPTAAERYGWGAPLPASDEFDYTGRPDPEKWHHPGECWPGHAGNGGRCASRSTVDGEKLVQTGLANGDSAWIASTFDQQYGRWEARVRSEGTGPDNGRQYHPLLIIWPRSDRWPEDGEYDFLENGAPGEKCAEAFIHYPHGPGAIQQEFVRESDCGAPLSEWHNVAIEWTPEHIRGFIDGEQWFSFSGGAQENRRAIQDMPSGHLTIQLDNFFGGNMQPAVYEVDWVRIYDLDDG